MINKISLFVIVSIIQLAIPLSLMLKSQKTVNEGSTYKFLCRPLDPNDPFRGKYLNITYKENTVPISLADQWQLGEVIHVAIQRDAEGFAEFGYSTRNIPDGDYLDLTINDIDSVNQKVSVIMPYRRLYVSEDIAKPAEIIYFQLLRQRKIYAEITINQGNGVLSRLGLDDRDFLDVVREIQNGDSTELKKNTRTENNF